MSQLTKTIASQPTGDPLVYVLSDETVDRAGDIIRASGWDLTNFSKNPIALFGHDHHFVIGRWSDVKVRGKQLIGRLNLLPEGVSARLDELRAAISAGVLRAISVGFLPDREAAEPNKHGGYTYGRAELTEASLVAVGMNPSCLQLAKNLNLTERARSLIFSKGGSGGHVPVVRLDSISRGRDRVVSIGKPFKLRKIHTVPKWKVGMPIKVHPPAGHVRVVKLERQYRTPEEPKGPHRVVKLTAEDRDRAHRRLTHRVVKLRGR